MQFSFWQVYYCNSAISFFDGFRSLPCFLQLRKGERQSGYSCVCFVKYSQFTCLVTMHGACELHLSTHFTVGCAESSHPTIYVI